MQSAHSRTTRRDATRGLVALVALLLVVAAPALGQPSGDMEDVFGGLGTAKTVDEDAAAPTGQEAGEGGISGRVFDGQSGLPVAGVTVVLTHPAPPDGGEPRLEVRTTDADGGYRFESVPEGSYTLSFTKAGYRASTMENFQVAAGQANQADFPLPPLPAEAGEQVLELDAFVVEASVVGEMMASLELRMDSDVQLNVMSAEDLSKYAAGDVAEALKRVAGVNVVEGQFAIIRGLEDRYSSTLYNHAPIPSPDPNRQSVQLDLFPSEVVSDLVVAKTFAPGLPGNAAGGDIDIQTHSYPPEFDFKLYGAAGLDTNSLDRFLEFVPHSSVGRESGGWDTIEQEYGGYVGGTHELFDREVRYKAVFNWERGYDTAEGWQETRQPRRPTFLQEGRPNERVLAPGGGATGELELTGGHFDQTISEVAQQLTAYGGLGFDIDAAAKHRIDASAFYTDKTQQVVDFRENGWLPGFDYSDAAAAQARDGKLTDAENYFLQDGRRCQVCATRGSWLGSSVRDDPLDGATKGPLWFTSFMGSTSFDIHRNLLVAQVNGDHEIDALDGLHLTWAANHASTQQDETALGSRIFFEPDAASSPDLVVPTEFPVRVSDLGPGIYATNGGIISSSNDVNEKQWFGRLDGDYTRQLGELLEVELQTGGWYEHATRDVFSTYLEGPSVDGNTQFAIGAPTLLDLGRSIIPSLDVSNAGTTSFTRETTNDSLRDVWAWNLAGKGTLWSQFDILGGFRMENITIESNNDPFTGEDRYGAPATFPEVYLLFDRLDNPARGEVQRPLPAGTVFNDELLGIDVPVDPVTGYVDFLTEEEIQGIVNGRIDERKILPTAGFAWRPLEGVTWRGSWSKTAARPSFREMGFYASVDLGTDDVTVGNPQLQLSEVTSWDTRVEYVFGNLGDLVAVSGFYKLIDNPIETILIRNPIDLREGVLYRTFFNNPNQAKLWGIEVEARKHLDFVGWDLGDYISLGGNFTWIEAEVDRTDAELSRASVFYRTPTGQEARFDGLEPSRRLFGQPRWIANADVSFDQPDWGTRATVAFFAISDILDAAGSASLGTDGRNLALTFDRYLDSYYQLDVILSQTWRPAFLNGGGLTFKLSAKNLTDSVRGRHYDEAQTNGTVNERKYKVGRAFKFSISYSF